MIEREANSVHPSESTESHLSFKLFELAFLGGVLIVYIALLAISQYVTDNHELQDWLRLLSTNIWLLSMCLLWIRKYPMQEAFWDFSGRGIKVLSFFIATLVIVSPALWPGKGTIIGSPAQLYILILLVPVAEELYFRGLLLEHLRQNIGKFGAIVCVSGLFGFMHSAQGIMSMMVILSIALCMTVLKTRNICWAIALHLGWNALSVTLKMPDGPARWIVSVSSGSILVFLILFVSQHKADSNA